MPGHYFVCIGLRAKPVVTTRTTVANSIERPQRP